MGAMHICIGPPPPKGEGDELTQASLPPPPCGIYHGDCTNRWQGFLQLIEQLRETGVQPGKGDVWPTTGINSWWQSHTYCFTQAKEDPISEDERAETTPKTPRVAVFAMCPALRGSTVSYAGDAHFPKHSLEYSLNFWSQSKKHQE